MTLGSQSPRPAAPLRVVFLTRGAFGERVLARLQSCPALELCGIVRSVRTWDPRLSPVRGAWRIIRHCGPLYALYLGIADGLAARSATGRCPVLRTRDVNTPQGLAFLERCRPDLLVSAFFDQRLRPAALALARRAAVNIHPSLLPHFRGVDPVLQARLQGAPLGVSVHHMSPELDSGPLIRQRALTVPPGVSLWRATAALFESGATLLIEALGALAAGEPGMPQAGGGSYQSWPRWREVQALGACGMPLLKGSDLALLRRPGAGTVALMAT